MTKWRGFAHNMPHLPPVPFVALDLETTGLRHGVDRIVQVGVVRVLEDRDERMAELVNPEMPIPAEATAVHGITDEMVRGAGPFASVAARMAVMFAGASCVVVFNGRRFDVPFLQEELLRVGAEDFTRGIPVLDVMDLDRQLRPRTLAGVHQAWVGCEPDAQHSAMGDVLATLAVLQGMPVDARDPGKLAEEATPERERGILDPHGWFRRREDGVVVLARGKHKDAELGRAPLAYLQWMAAADEMPPRTVRTVKAVVEKRLKRGEIPVFRRPDGSLVAVEPVRWDTSKCVVTMSAGAPVPRETAEEGGRTPPHAGLERGVVTVSGAGAQPSAVQREPEEPSASAPEPGA